MLNTTQRYIIVAGMTDSIIKSAEELKVFICFFCGERFGDKHGLTRHQDTCSLRSAGLETLLRDLKLPNNNEHQEPKHGRSKMRHFMQHFGVTSVERAKALNRRRLGEQVVCDVIVIDESDEDDSELESPVTSPMSPKRLIPYDGRNFRRSSSICRHSSEKNAAVVVKRTSDVFTTSHSAEKLLRIDVSSPLGQRLRDHVKLLNSRKCDASADEWKRPAVGSVSRSNRSVVIPKNANGSTWWPTSFAQNESPFVDRLRQPSEYRVTYRGNRKHLHSHEYRFTGRQRKEFCRAFDCGLSVRARRQLRRMTPCRVNVQKLTQKTIDMYKSRALESELQTTNQNGLVLQISKCVTVNLTKCDDQLTGGSVLENEDLGDLNSSDVVDCQTAFDPYRSGGLPSSFCDTRQTSGSGTECCQYQSDRETCPTVTAASPLTIANDISVELSQQSKTPTSSLNVAVSNAIENSDLLLVNGANDVCHDDIDENATVETGSCSDSQTACSSDDYVGPTEDTPRTARDGSSWSMSDDLPALSFLCNICGDLVECEGDSRSLIYDHYAGHGITNIELMDETTPDGEQVVKLVELPSVKTSTTTVSKSTPTRGASSSVGCRRRNSTAKSILAPVQAPSCPGGDDGVGSGGCGSSPPKRVTWADEVCGDKTQQAQHEPSPVCLDVPRQDAAESHSSKRRLYNDNTATDLPTPVVAIQSEHNVVVTNSSSTAAVGKTPTTANPLPATSRSDTAVSNATGRRNAVAVASKRARLFWSNSSLGEVSGLGNHSSVPEHSRLARRPASSASIVRSKPAVNNVPASVSAAIGAERDDGADVHRSRKSPRLCTSTITASNTNSVVQSGNRSYAPQTMPNLTPRARDITWNARRPSSQAETNVICID